MFVKRALEKNGDEGRVGKGEKSNGWTTVKLNEKETKKKGKLKRKSQIYKDINRDRKRGTRKRKKRGKRQVKEIANENGIKGSVHLHCKIYH